MGRVIGFSSRGLDTVERRALFLAAVLLAIGI